MQVLFLKFTNEEFVSKVYFRYIMKQKLNLKNPKTFNEKINWLKLYNFPKNDLVIKCTDKYAVREFVRDRGCKDYLNELYGVWESAEEIDWNLLPNKFVLKCNHGSAYHIICNDKDTFNINQAKKILSKWMKEDFSLFNVEPHYSYISRKIICEKHLGIDIIDYKYFCFNGKPEFMYVAKGFGVAKDERMSFFDLEGEMTQFKRLDYRQLEKEYILPSTTKEMEKLSKILSRGFPFVRVDFFEIEGKIYFSELTFTPNGGLMPIEPKIYDDKWGDLININHIEVKNI